MNKNDYIAQVDSIEFSPDLEQKLIDGVALAKPSKKHVFYPLSAVAACILLAVVIALPLARNGGKTADNSVVETQDFKEKTTTYTYSSEFENYLADSSLSYSDGMAAGGTLEEESSDVARLLHCLKLTHKNGDSLTKAEYEAECERLSSLGYDAHVYENDGDIPVDCEICILLGLLGDEEFDDTEYNFELTLVTE